ncbi:C2 domain-containing protein 3 [Bombina bombina]|uniref:C2 domain-containing protein 3 n=1 Tax=Bombina bombina TaxID=8345 RepID=UPI00235A519A|nr:C2 domain-containing protein 3 [Bombina bombina]
MKTRKDKNMRPRSKRRKGATDIPPSTSLPPLVEGQLRCFLQVTVSKILWTIPKPPTSVLVRLRWWGETTDGTVFRPRDTSQTEQKGVKTTTRYAVRCGPKQFTSYLTDMGALVLDVMTKLDHLPIGRVQINGIPQLSPTHPLSGFFTIVSPTSEKLGELQVFVALEPLSETYDTSSSSVVNTDISLDGGVSQTVKLTVPSAGFKESESDSRVTTPRGRDHLYFQKNGGSQDNLNVEKGLLIENMSTRKQVPNYRTLEKTSAEQLKDAHKSTCAPATKDLLSALLDQGSKLRDAMVVSALRSEPSVDRDVDSLLPPTLKKQPYSIAASRSAPESSLLLQNLLNVQKSSASRDRANQPSDCAQPEIDTHSETRAIELLLGSSAFSHGHYWDGVGSPPESVSGGSDFCNESELNDPLYDQSLLEKLFYTAPKSDSSLSDYINDEEEPKICSKKAKNKVLQAEENITLRDTSIQEIPERLHSEVPKSDAVNLTMDQLTLLGRMHIARVVVESLRVPLESSQITPSKGSSRGKPPRPVSSVKQTYFVEFHFPVSSKNRAGDISLATEITRLVSSKIVGGLVKFQQRFVFPIMFSGQMIEHWWNTDLTFKIFLRKGSQKKPGLIGSASFSLCDVLKSESLSVTCNLPVLCSEDNQEKTAVGPLKVSVELAGESKDLLSTTEKTSGSAKPMQSYPLHHGVTITKPESHPAADTDTSIQAKSMYYAPPVRQSDLQHTVTDVQRMPLSQAIEMPPEEDGLLLHVVLMVPEGKGLTTASANSSSSCNPYLNCKLFSAQEATRSSVAWGTTQPVFNFSQVAPVSLTSRLLDRLKNNVMIIEVWNKVPSPGHDQLLGLAKLPLHQFYMSFSDRKISRLLLQAQYPVVAVDSFVQVTDVFSGGEWGKLKVLLAMGLGDQIVALQRLKNEEVPTPVQPQRPAHFLDPPQVSVQTCWPQEGTIEHIFDIHVENVIGLTPLQSTVWGEADCYVQYTFPAHLSDSSKAGELPEADITLKPVRTATTLCVPDPVLNDRQSHTLVAQSDTPVQRLLLSAFSTQGLSGGGGVPFEVWCRYYYPNVRDQMVAKCLLPLSRLCAMVTMQHREEVGIQAFSLPLTPKSKESEGLAPQSLGLLNVSITYRRSIRNPAGILATRMVSLSVQIHRASGLQAAARLVAEQDPTFQYTADVGVNSYVAIHPSFLPEAEKRLTRTVARTFAPEFDHHSEFPCNLVIQRSGGENCSLAEVLHYSEITFTIYHQSVASAATARSQLACDHLLGVVKIPTKQLITKRSGVNGWYPVTVPEDAQISSGADIMKAIVGGLEISVRFAHPSDRERVLEVAQGLGWSEEDSSESSVHGDDEWQTKEDLISLSVAIPKLWLPVHCLLLAGHKHIHRSTYCYLRYKLYDKEAVCSPLKRPKLAEDRRQATVMFEQTKSIELIRHWPLLWYLREERLEFQVWLSYGKDTSGPRPQDTDRLLGCAYVDLTPLAERTSRTLTVSGVYPMFKHNVSNLWGAAVRIHIALCSAYHQSVFTHDLSYSRERSCSEEDEPDDFSKNHDEDSSGKGQKPQPEIPVTSPSDHIEELDLESTFAVNIVVERAMHLSLKGSPLTERAVSAPTSCVSFSVAGSATAVMTPIIENTDSPTWNFQHQTRLNKELLLDPQQTFVFKVWHKTDVERVLGFASVDLSPLLSGFSSVCGWYNIVDFAGQCQGQVKVSITPLESIVHLKDERRARSEATQPEVTSQRSFLYQPRPLLPSSFSSYSIGHSDISRPPIRHDEHMKNVRRFHESLQQAERNTRSAEQLDILSQSTRSSLLSALRKNLSELDDIQKYFSQKLYGSISSSTDPMEGLSNLIHKTEKENTSNSVCHSDDSDAQLLLKRSNLLVSQVSSLITDLQTAHKTTREPLSTPQGGSNTHNVAMRADSGVQYQQGVAVEPINCEQPISDDIESLHRDTPPFHLAELPSDEEDNLEEGLEQGLNEKEEQLEAEQHCDQAELNADYCSDEDYEEDFIEPRTLNEITTMTDRTSPWSSILSDAESDSMEQRLSRRQTQPVATSFSENHSEETELLPDLEYNQVLVPISTTSEDTDGDSEPRVLNDNTKPEIHKSQPLARYSIEDHVMQESHTDDINKIREEGPEEPYSIFRRESTGVSSSSSDTEDYQPSHVGNTRSSISSVVPQSEESKSDYPSSRSRSSEQVASLSEDNEEELNTEPESTAVKSTGLLPEPVLVPNFFLPPQHLEASMRLLSLSPSLPVTTTHKTGSETQIAKGIPFRRHARQRHVLTSENLPKEETDRIARIFSSQFTKKK